MNAPRSRESAFSRLSPSAKFDSVVLAALVVVMCSQINLLAIGKNTFETEGFVTKQLFVALSDVAMLGTLAWFAVRTSVLRAWGRLWYPPVPCFALVIALFIATMHSQTVVHAIADAAHNPHGLHGLMKIARATKSVQEGKEALVKIPQYALYFLVAPFLFVNLILDRREGELVERRRLALLSFASAALGTVLIGALQFALQTTSLQPGTPHPNLPPSNHPPHGLFQSANLYAAFLAVALPLLLARIMRRWNGHSFVFVAAGITLVCGLFTMTSIWAVVALCLGLATAGIFLQVPNRLALVLGATLVVAYAVWTLPSKLAVNRADYAPTRMVVAAAPSGDDDASAHPGGPAASLQVDKQFIEWFVALGWSMPHPIPDTNPPERTRAFATGVGPGNNYQLNIGTLYQSGGSLADVDKEKIPPDSNNLYLVQAVSIGMLGLGTLCWVLGYFVKQGLVAQRRFPGDWLGAGTAGSLVAFCVANVFHAMVERGTGIVLAFLFSLAVVALSRASIDEES